MKQFYKWSISELEKVKEYYLSLEDIAERQRKEILNLIFEMFFLMEGKQPLDEQNRIATLFNNCLYYITSSPKQQTSFRILKEKMLPISQSSVYYHKFSLKDILELLEEFINWCPSKEIREVMQYYYQNCLSDHFYYSQSKKIYPVRGFTYEFDAFYPFVIVEKCTFIETFLTLVHEIGHVVTGMQRMKQEIRFCHPFFCEIDGKYFELLALQFLIEKQFGIEEGIDSAISDYHGVKGCVESIQFPYLLKKKLVAEEYLREIYSYLGALDLLNRYQGDYEKQLTDLYSLFRISTFSLSQYFEQADFHFFENEFAVLVKHRRWLEQNKSTNSL